MSTVLVTGGTGFVGRHLISALASRGDTVRVLALPNDETGWLDRLGVLVCRGDVRRAETLPPAVAGADSVVHLAAMMDLWRPMRDYHAVNVTGTTNLCRAACAAEVRRFVHMSSSSVYGIGLGRPVEETFALLPFRDPYPVTKAAADLAVQAMIAGELLPAVIIRPGQVIGPGDQMHFGRTADRLAARRAIIVGDGSNMLPIVYVSDVVQGLLLALDRGRAVGQAYNICSAEPLSQRQYLDAIATDTGARPPRRHIPYRVLYAAGAVAERLAGLAPGDLRPPVTRLGVAFAGTDNRYSIAKARAELGYSPAVSVRDGVRLTAAWYLAQGRSDAAGALM